MSHAVPLTEDRLAELYEFVSEMWRIDGAASEMHLGDVAFTLFFESTGTLEESAMLWYDEKSKLQAAGLCCGSTFDMVLRPQAQASNLADDMLAWAASQAKRRSPVGGTLRIQRRPAAAERVAFLQQRGFYRASSGAFTLECDLSRALQEHRLPDGFRCREVHRAEIPLRVDAFNAAFAHGFKSVADYESVMRCEIYDPTLDLIAIDSAGEVVAFATLWLDRANRTGLFEPVGTRPGYRRLGLARATMSEGLRRLKERGALSAVVRVRSDNAPALACYRDLGFSLVSDRFGFEQILAE